MIVFSQPIDDEISSLVEYHVKDLALGEELIISSAHFKGRVTEICNKLGYGSVGIKKGSVAARVMSEEARIASQNGDTLASIERGGLSACFQSAGSYESEIKDIAYSRMRLHLMRNGISIRDEEEYDAKDSDLIIFRIPRYWRLNSETCDSPKLYDDYKEGGFNHRQAETMLNAAFHENCKINRWPHCALIPQSPSFQIIKMERIENRNGLLDFVKQENRINCKLADTVVDFERPDVPEWLVKLSQKNGLKLSANSIYLRTAHTRNIWIKLFPEAFKLKSL